MAKITQIAERRKFKRIRDVILELQRAVPKSDDPDIEELKLHLYRARTSAERLMTH